MKHFIFKIIILFWNIFPFKLQLSKLIKKNNWLKEKLYKDLRYTGIMTIQVDNQKLKLYNPGFTTIENEIYWKGLNEGWEKVSMKLWQILVKNSTTIIDIGANTGIYSFVASKLNPEATIFAFEPVHRTSEIFKKNLAINLASKIKLISKAVSNKNGTSIFYDLPTESQYSASLNENMLNNYSDRISYDVDVITIDSIEMFKNKKIDLIKLDVEMHEPEAIEGMIKIIERNKPSILIEILNDEIAERVEAQISNFDYLYFSIDEVNPPQRVEKLRKSDHYNFLLCNIEIARKLKLL